MGNTRDIPPTAILHHSLLERLQMKELKYEPRNNHREEGDHCLMEMKTVVCLEPCGEHPAECVHESDHVCTNDCCHREHHTFMFKKYHDEMKEKEKTEREEELKKRKEENLKKTHGHRIEC